MRLCRAAVLAAGLAMICTQAQAGYHHVITPVVSKSSTAGGSGSGSNWHLCPTPAGIFICAVTVMIVADEVKRSIDGPACATMKPRRSWFGMVKDEPKLWRKLCKWKRDPKPIAVRG